MLYQSKLKENFIIKGRIIKYLPLFIIILIISNYSLLSQITYRTLDTYSVGCSYGISYLNSNENVVFTDNSNNETYLTNRQFGHLNIEFKTNTLPYISLNGLFLYSLNLQFSTNFLNNNSVFKYSRYSFNLSTYESFLKSITVHPILGLGYVQATLKNDQLTNITSINFNIGGGFDARLKVFENLDYKINLLQSINLLYSIMLKKLDNSYQGNNTSTFEIKYSISFELQKKERID